MKVIAFNGSPRKNGNTSILIEKVFGELEKEGIETELVWLGNKPLQGCIACFGCQKAKNKQCVLKNDAMNEYIEKMLEADGIIFGAPVYCTDAPANMHALIERTSFVGKMNEDMFKRKVGASVVAVRRNGGVATFDRLNAFFTIEQMIIVGSSYWNQGVGLNIGDVEQDEEGLQTMVNLGQNMAWLLKKIHG